MSYTANDFMRAVERLSETGLSVSYQDRGGFIATWPDGHWEKFSGPRESEIPELQEINTPEWFADMLDDCHRFWLKAPVWKPH